MAARGRLQKILLAKILKNLKSKIIQILLSHSPPHGNAGAGDIFKVLLKIKMAATVQLQFF